MTQLWISYGRYLAALSSAKGRRDFLVVFELASNKPTVVAAYNDSDIATFRWVNNDRLVYEVSDNTVGQGDTRYFPGLYAVDKDGGRMLQLVDRYTPDTARAGSLGRNVLPGDHFLHPQVGPQDSNFVYVTHPIGAKGELRYAVLLKVDTVTGRSTTMPRPYEIQSWVMDNQGEPRLGYKSGEGTTTVYYRDPATNAWRVLATYNTYTDNLNPITPIAFDNSGVLYVEARGGKDTKSLYTFNFATGKINPEPLVVTTGYDFDGGLVRNRDKVLGVIVTTDATANEWFVPEMKALQEKVDKALPVTVNLLLPPADPAAENMLVRSYSDVVPAMYSVYNVKTGMLAPVGSTRQAINPAQMGPQKAISYRSRDGLTIPALLTLPRAGTRKNLPMVVLVHGGPWVRGATWGWSSIPQFLASRGYAVLEPEFRGALGYGNKLYHAGWKQWGLGGAGSAGRESSSRRARLCRCQTHLHRRSQLWRLCHADGPGQRPRPVQVRCRLGGRHGHQPDVQRRLDRQFRQHRRLPQTRHAGPDWRPGQGRRPAARHVADRAGGAHHPASDPGVRWQRPPCADFPWPQVLRCRQGAQQERRMDRVSGRGPWLARAGK
jgi:dipeptidyl aminopeptidase/acylaminoacyl peptidase